ncbi:VOC family protein [Haloprofundus salilacus]|uniref:VOC family protein n=1 Tax=Haloprofundus salilacus TaxID=2876190 RepID=UPI001CC98316|nr:VOC family protein [Haloprofundus salilacus]
MEFTGIDHFVLTVEDIEETCAFYSALGAEIVTYGEGRTALQFGEQKINLHPAGDEFEPKAVSPTPGAGDFCVLTALSIDAVEERLRDAGVAVVEGPVARTGTTGPITSVYVRDPDGNLVELAASAAQTGE